MSSMPETRRTKSGDNYKSWARVHSTSYGSQASSHT
jgi:hypothetical protein